MTERSTLRLSDLKTRIPQASKLMNMKVPVDTWAGIEKLAKEFKATKTSVVVALLNEALAVAARTHKG